MTLASFALLAVAMTCLLISAAVYLRSRPRRARAAVLAAVAVIGAAAWAWYTYRQAMG